MMQTFEQLFKQATSHPPYSYQARLALSKKMPRVLNVPTGAGKTAASFFTWLWRRRYHPEYAVRARTPRRLVYCLPMRVLVEQTHSTIRAYLEALNLDQDIGTYVLMGGDIDDDWQLCPDHDAVIIGTQDILLSRALNRGYAMSRFRWPITYALLNNDALWVIDEVQLMGAGIPTTTQLEAFRQIFGTFGPTHTLWMSATVRSEWLKTADHPPPAEQDIFQLTPHEKEEQGIKSNLQAPKLLRKLEMNTGAKARGYPKELAEKTLARHQPGTQTLLIVNTVTRAQEISAAMQETLSKTTFGEMQPEILLLHSRFRPWDRTEKVGLLTDKAEPKAVNRIVISTQVVEAGVDITSATLVSEMAPWSSMVQRFGRCNRYGEAKDGRVYWVDLTEKAFAPYNAGPMKNSREILTRLENSSVSPGSLAAPDSTAESHHVLRKKDLVELFDTAPDLSGNDVDVSRFIRDTDETNVHLFWRDWGPDDQPPPDEPHPAREELCPAPIDQIRDYIATGKSPWRWDYQDRRWRKVTRAELFPGQILLLHSKAGGYDAFTGWNPASSEAVIAVPLEQPQPSESGGDDHNTFTGRWQTLVEHSEDTRTEMEALIAAIGSGIINGHLDNELKAAAFWHDLGKAHPVFQETLLEGLSHAEMMMRKSVLWAKAPRSPDRPFQHSRPHFRHELASMLALFDNTNDLRLSNLALYLVAAHHGKVRLAIRSIPGSDGHPHGRNKPLAILGIEEGDRLPPVELAEGQALPETTLTLLPAQLGEAGGSKSWLSRTLTLLDEHGPFRLAFMEALVRLADIRASVRGAGGVL